MQELCNHQSKQIDEQNSKVRELQAEVKQLQTQLDRKSVASQGFGYGASNTNGRSLHYLFVQ